MSTSNLTLQPVTYPPQSTDDRLIALLDQIRRSVVDLLQSDIPPKISADDLSLGMQTLKTVADTAWRLAEKRRIAENVKLILADIEKIKAGMEKTMMEKM